jgi:hypothetical protein
VPSATNGSSAIRARAFWLAIVPMAVLALLGIALALQVVIFGASQTSSGDSPTNDAKVVTEPSHWVKLLHDGSAEVELRQRVVAADGTVADNALGTIHAVGKLLPEEVLQARETLSGLEELREKWLLQAQGRLEKTGDILDNLKFAKRLVDVEEARAATRALHASSYYVEEHDHSIPAVAGMRYVGIAVQRNGKSLFVTLAIEIAEHVALRDAISYLEATEQQAALAACEDFNRLDLERRRTLIERFQNASASMQKNDKELARYFRPGLVIVAGYLLARR